MSRHLLLIVVAAGLILACRPSVPSQFIQPDDMEDLLYDYHIAQAMASVSTDGADSRAFNETLYFAAVLEKHGVTKAEFDSSLTYYYIRADRFGDIYKNVVKRLNNSAQSLGAPERELQQISTLNINSDTVDVWKGRVSAMLMPYPPYNRLDFEQKVDTSYRNGDSFIFIVNNDFIFQHGTRMAEACLVMKYDNDTIVSKAFSLSSSGVNQMRFPAVGNHRVKDIRGYIYMAPETEASSTLKLLIVKNIQLVRMRKKEMDKTEQKKDSVANSADEIQVDTLKTKEL